MDGRDDSAIDDETINLVAEWTFRDDLSLFLGNNPGPFLRYHEKSQRVRRPVSFCWPALLVPLSWFMYRRMYALTAAILLLGAALTAVLPAGGHTSTLGIPVIFAVLGKPVYLHMARRKIDKAGRLAMSEPDRQRRIVRSGGVSVVGAIVGAVITAMPFFMILAEHL